MHVSSLASPYGIGTMGKSAYEFVDFLKASKTSVWQVLPIGQTGYGDSPYQSVSSFAGNPYFIDLDILVEEGFLLKSDLPIEEIYEEKVDFGKMYVKRYKILKCSYKKSYKKVEVEVRKFRAENSWLEDYAYFMAIKNHFGGISWQEWADEEIKMHEESAITRYGDMLCEDIEFYCYIQYLFYKQWKKLRKYANENGVKICGDMPIYCAMDSADVWANSENFQLSKEKRAEKVAGVPPDYFAEDGQLWGNPLFDWEYLKNNDYKFWIDRMKSTSELFDIVRLDHFIGFVKYYSISADATNAKEGIWNEGPMYSLFDKIKAEVPNLEIIAEDLGVIFEEVYQMKTHYGYPGMHILTFMLDPNEGTSTAINDIKENSIVYTGTHDNDTTIGWWNSLTDEEKNNIAGKIDLKYGENVADKLIEICFESRSETVVIPIQDYLYLGQEARMNIPGVASGNWQFRVKTDAINLELATKIAKLSEKYQR